MDKEENDHVRLFIEHGINNGLQGTDLQSSYQLDPNNMDTEQTKTWRSMEQSSGLKSGAIRGVHWIKPKHLQALEQRTAIAIFKLAMCEDTNWIIRKGLFMEGKKVWGRKL